MSEVSQPNELIETIEKALERYHEIKSEPTDLPGMNSQRMLELSFDLKQITRNFPEWLRALQDEVERLNHVLEQIEHDSMDIDTVLYAKRNRTHFEVNHE